MTAPAKMPDLEPCPFCGGEAITRTRLGGHAQWSEMAEPHKEKLRADTEAALIAALALEGK